MKVQTQSGVLTLRARSPYAKWLLGWKDGGAWTGHGTVASAWVTAREHKLIGCSWYALGRLMASQQAIGRKLQAAYWD